MVAYGPYEAWIQGPDGPLPEYDVKFDGKIVQCYIVGQHRAYFQVHWVDYGTALHSAAWVIVDGEITPGKFIQGGGHKSRSGFRVNQTEEIPFEFTKTKGTIALKIALVKDGSKRPSDDPSELYSKRLQAQKDKGRPQRVEFKQNTTAQAGYTYNVQAPGQPAESCVKFIFRYHPEEWLRRHGILERPSEPSPEMERFMMFHTNAQTASRDTSASVTPVPTAPPPLAFSFYKPVQGFPVHAATSTPTPPPALVPGEHKRDKGKQPARTRSKSKRRKNSPVDQSPDAGYEKQFGHSPNVPKLTLPESKPSPTNIQQHPRAYSTYIFATRPASSSSMPGPSSGPPPVQFPYLTPSGRPSAIIDTRFFGRSAKTDSPPSSQ